MKKNKKEIVAELREQLSEMDHFLEYGYVKKVKEKLAYEVEDGTIIAVKNGHRHTVAILAAILSVAKEARDAATKSIEQ